MTATQLLAFARGVPLDEGDHRCFYCGAACDEQRPLKPPKTRRAKGEPKPREYLKDTFTDWASVACPESDYCCAGCALALDEKADINGRTNQKMRNYSWMLTRGQAAAKTKADIDELRGVCLDPPEPPYAIVIAVSGQKHTLFRAPVNHSRTYIVVQLETMHVGYSPGELRARIRLVNQLLPAVGKQRMADAEPIRIANAIKLYDELGDYDADRLIAEWNRVSGQPLSRLAVFLTPRDGVEL